MAKKIVKKKVAAKKKVQKKATTSKVSKNKKVATVKSKVVKAKNIKKTPAKVSKSKPLKVKIPETLKETEIKDNNQTIQTLPKEQMEQVNRPPVRKIISANGIIRVVNNNENSKLPAKQEISIPIVTANASTKIENFKIETIKPVIEQKIAEKIHAQKFTWDTLPKYMPGQVRFLVKASQTECLNADSPFAFSKFIKSLPESICGLEFAFLILSLEHSDQAIADLCKMTNDHVEKIIENACQNFSEKFSSECLDMTRKLRTQLAGSGLDMDSLIEQYFIQKVDKSFQIMLGAVILRSLGVKSLHYQPTAIAS